jgi:hypothetical protein
MAAEAAYGVTVNVTSQPAIAFTNEAMTDSGDKTTYTITNSAKRYIDINTALVVQVEHDEVQSVTITGSPTGGTFTLTFGANTTSTIAFNASAATVQAALVALASIGSGNASVTGANGGPWTVEFISGKGNANQALITLGTNSLTGGSSPNVAIAVVQDGSGFTTVAATTYTVKHAGGIVTFNSANAQGTTVRLSSGAYYAYAVIASAHMAEYAAKCAALDVTTFNSSGIETYLGGLLSGTLKCSTWWASTARAASLTARDLLVLSFQTVSGRRFEGYVYATDCNIKSDVKTAISEDLTFILTNEFFSN